MTSAAQRGSLSVDAVVEIQVGEGDHTDTHGVYTRKKNKIKSSPSKNGLLIKLKSMAARWCDLETQVRSSNEAVWGGSFEDLNDPKREIRASRIRILATLVDRHTLFRNKNTHARLCCQVEKHRHGK